MKVRRLTKAAVAGRTVLVRVGYDVPVDRRGRVADAFRIDRSIPTLRYLRAAGCRIILIAHRGKPKGKRAPSLSLKAVLPHLRRRLGTRVRFVDIRWPTVERAVARLAPKDVLLIENLRFLPGERGADPLFARKLAALADVYVNDDFSTAHRAHASTVLLPRLLPSYAGLNLAEEVATLSRLHEHPRRPFSIVIGGGKVKDKLSVITHLLPHVDHVLLGGAPASTVLQARGWQVGTSLVDPTLSRRSPALLGRSRKVVLPTDVVVAASSSARTGRVAQRDALGPRDAIFDVGPETLATFTTLLQGSRTIFWAGPIGYTENPTFTKGTRAIARSFPRRALSVVGGGDTVRALHDAHLAGRCTFLSTGGSALLKFMAGERLPALIALQP